MLLGLIIYGLSKGPVLVREVAAHRMLQAGDGFRRPGVGLAPQPVGVGSADVEHVCVDRGVAIGIAMPADCLLGDLHESGPLDGGGSPGEEGLDELAGQADGIEDLGSAVGLIGRDAHLGHDLQNALAHGLDVVLADLIRGLRQLVADPDVLEGLEGQVGVHRLGTVTRQDAEVVHLTGLAGLDDQAGLHTQALADQVMVHRRRGQGRGDRDPVGRGLAVREDQDIAVCQDLVSGLSAEALDRTLQARRAFRGRPGCVQGCGAEGTVQQIVDRADLGQVLIGEDGLGDLKALVSAGLASEQVRSRPDH